LPEKKKTRGGKGADAINNPLGGGRRKQKNKKVNQREDSKKEQAQRIKNCVERERWNSYRLSNINQSGHTRLDMGGTYRKKNTCGEEMPFALKKQEKPKGGKLNQRLGVNQGIGKKFKNLADTMEGGQVKGFGKRGKHIQGKTPNRKKS